MAAHNDLGKLGEQVATDFLRQKNYTILTTNFRYKRAEIDIIAKDDSDTLVFVEVKTRSANDLYLPEKNMTSKKQSLIQQAAIHYMRKIGHEWAIRFDLIAIVLKKKNQYELRHIEDVFFR